jgi:ribonuclease HI
MRRARSLRQPNEECMTLDTLTFDGSCNPNPGGQLGYGWTITWADGRTQDGRGERPRHPENTVNVAEYNGLIAGLQAYLAASGQGPLTIRGDSQLIVGQVSGTMKTRQPHLAKLRDVAQALMRRVSKGATIRWNPREENSAADLLARGPQEQGSATPTDRTYVADVQQAPIAPELRTSIARLNVHPGPGFGDFARLRVGGTDALSSLKLAQLTQQAGADATAAVMRAFPDNLTQQAAVLRWAMRGLAVELAIRKGQVDAELAERAAPGRNRR